MSITKFLKKLFPKEINLVKIEHLHYTKYNQSIEKSIGKVENLTIEDKNNVLGYVREDLLETEAELISPQQEFKKYITDFRPYMNDDDHGALVTASAIIKLERKGKNKLASKILDALAKNYPLRGRKIYNLLESGYFEEYIHPKLQEIKKEYEGDEFRIRGAFSYFFEDVMRYFKYAIWITESTSLKDIEMKLLQRLMTSEQPMVFVHARRAICIDKLDNAIEAFKKDHGVEFEYEEWLYDLRGAKAKTAVVIKKEMKRILKSKQLPKTSKKKEK